jgi:hypothetical protein
MDRRNFIRTACIGGASLAAASGARAAIQNLGFVPSMYGPVQAQRAFVQRPARITQECAQWCWAASCSMIFSMFNHPFDQTQIVQRVFGGLVCAPAAAGILMAQVLSDSWTDTSGTGFSSHLTAAYDPQAGVVAINNAILVNELINDRPLLYANKHHAMVVVSADFVPSPMGPSVVAVGVLDPWPYSPAYHPLNQAELMPAHMGGDMMFLASVSVV